MGATERGLRKRLVLENTRPYGLVCLFWCACGLAGARMVVRSPGTNSCARSATSEDYRFANGELTNPATWTWQPGKYYGTTYHSIHF